MYNYKKIEQRTLFKGNLNRTLGVFNHEIKKNDPSKKDVFDKTMFLYYKDPRPDTNQAELRDKRYKIK
eukprot:CAMPEP_0116937944 /NCGR_PEP_ID=MMETSP0467-20121206/31808_1 /TAXON_ID=283647 /ORGANISM="Mesodinium pulex, Strain SPMC105" /LENGTH=67 /DNA_ID=CAMNT_0004619861 /DNA_START=685 /DNA_END=888 /DNA_ORIENTATION=+